MLCLGGFVGVIGGMRVYAILQGMEDLSRLDHALVHFGQFDLGNSTTSHFDFAVFMHQGKRGGEEKINGMWLLKERSMPRGSSKPLIRTNSN